MRNRLAGSGLLVVLSLALCAQGCSLIFVSGPPDGHERLRYFDCVSNGAALAGDASWALFDGVLAAALASADGEVNEDTGEKMETGGGAALFGVAAAIHAGSLIYGVIRTDHCSSAKAHLQQRIAEQDAETKARIEELELQLGAPAVPAPTAAPAAGTPQVLELVPEGGAPAAGTAVPPPPDAYTQPPPAPPAAQPAQPAPPATTPAKP